jgi:hypothetical protein
MHIYLLYPVKPLFIFASISAVLCFSPAKAQDEQWDTYMVRMGKMPASVLVDMALVGSAPDKKFPYLVITGPKTKNCDTHGLPDHEEISLLETILDASGNFLTGVTPKVLVGTVTKNCERVNYYYVKDTIGIRNALNRLYTHSYPTYAYVIGIKYDPEWMTYRKNLYPDEDTRNWMENDKVIMAMLKQGDSLAGKRNINFDISFHSDTDRAAFIVYAKAKGFNTREAINATATNAPYQVMVYTYNSVKSEVINPMALDLKNEAKRRRGIYNGWEAKK